MERTSLKSFFLGALETARGRKGAPRPLPGRRVVREETERDWRFQLHAALRKAQLGALTHRICRVVQHAHEFFKFGTGFAPLVRVNECLCPLVLHFGGFAVRKLRAKLFL